MISHRTIRWSSTIAFGLMMVVVPILHGPQHAHLPGTHAGCSHAICGERTSEPAAAPMPHAGCCHHAHPRPGVVAVPDSNPPHAPEHSDDCPVCELLGQPVLPAALVLLEVECDLVTAAQEASLPSVRESLLSIPPARGPPSDA